MNPVLAPGPFNAANRSAVGPNYGKGMPYHPFWRPNGLSEGNVVVIPANFGEHGGSVGYQRERLDIIGSPLEPARLTHKPVWNMLIPVANWHLQVMTKQQLQSFENSQDVQAPQIPMTFSAPGTASLFK